MPSAHAAKYMGEGGRGKGGGGAVRTRFSSKAHHGMILHAQASEQTQTTCFKGSDNSCPGALRSWVFEVKTKR